MYWLTNKRLILVIVLWLASVFGLALTASLSIENAPGSEYTQSGAFTGPSKLITPLVRFDSAHYINIVQNEYSQTPTLKVFFPLFPLILKVFSWPLAVFLPPVTAIVLTSIFVNSIFVLLAIWLTAKLFELDTGVRNAKAASLLILATPFSFFFAALYTEALFLLLVVSTLYCARTKKWWLAGLLAALAGLTRLPAILLVGFLVLEYLDQIGWSFKKIQTNVLALVLSVLGTLSYFVYLHFNGGVSAYFNAYKVGWPERQLDLNIIANIMQPVINMLTGKGIMLNEILALFMIAIATVILILSWKRMRISYKFFVIASMLLPLTTNTLDSLSRYYIVIVPLYLYGYLLIKDRPWKLGVLFISAMLAGLLITLFTNGYFVG